jgi:hypothetical protein
LAISKCRNSRRGGSNSAGLQGQYQCNVRVVGKEEDGGQVDCDGDEEGNGDGDEGGK